MQGKHDKVIAALKRIAGINKKTLPDLHPESQIEVTFKFFLIQIILSNLT